MRRAEDLMRCQDLIGKKFRTTLVLNFACMRVQLSSRDRPDLVCPNYDDAWDPPLITSSFGARV